MRREVDHRELLWKECRFELRHSGPEEFIRYRATLRVVNKTCLEEFELGRVNRGGLFQCSQCLDNNMRVALNKTTLQLLRSTIVILLSVDEVPADEFVDGHLDGKCRTCLDSLKVSRFGKFTRRHVVRTGNVSHGDWVARTILGL